MRRLVLEVEVDESADDVEDEAGDDDTEDDESGTGRRRRRRGRIITPNIDILRQAQTNKRVRGYLDDADLIVADGMPLVWASRLSGTPLPERVAGSSLIWSLSQGLGRGR